MLELLETCLPLSQQRATANISTFSSLLSAIPPIIIRPRVLVLIAYPRSHFHLHPHPQPKSPYPRISGCLGHPGSSRQYKGSFKAPAPGLPDSRLPGVSKVSQSRSGSGLLHIVPSRMHSTPHSSQASKNLLCVQRRSCSPRILHLLLAASSARSPFEYQGQELQAPFSEG